MIINFLLGMIITHIRFCLILGAIALCFLIIRFILKFSLIHFHLWPLDDEISIDVIHDIVHDIKGPKIFYGFKDHQDAYEEWKKRNE